MSTILIVGLGNPGKQYEKTRHNAGFLVLDALAKELELSFKERADLHASICETMIGDQKVILVKPTTFMNHSGQAANAVKNFFHEEEENIWLVLDDVTLPLGTMRVRSGGSSGGHNGLKSVIAKLGTEAFPRFRIGVDAPPENVPLDAWVLSKFSADEIIPLKIVVERTIEALLRGVKKGLDIKTHHIKDEA